MNKLRFPRHITHGLLALLLFAACSGNELTDGNPHGTPLPEGRYPLAFTATQSSATPQTRVSETADGNGSTWTDGDEISVCIGSGTQTGKYKLNADGSIKQTITPLYWQNTSQADVNGWYPATDGTVDLSDQSTGLKYVLKGTGTGSYQSTPTLTFTHQLAKVRVKLTGTAIGLENATIGVLGYPSCTHTKGEIVTGTGTKAYLAMHKVSYNGATYYEANVVPGTLEAANAFRITRGSKSTDVTLGGAVTLKAGKWHEITLTMAKAPLTPVDGKFTVNAGDDVLIQNYDGTAPIEVNGTATITIDNVKIASNNTTMAVKENATVKLHVIGTNNSFVSTSGGGIILSTGAGITITGDGENTSKLVVKASSQYVNQYAGYAGIGFDHNSNGNYGDLKIENISIDVTGGPKHNGYYTGPAAIGFSSYHSSSATNVICNSITIAGSTITATSYYGACIGTCALASGWASVNCEIKQITITNSKITANGNEGACVGFGLIKNNASGTIGRIEIKKTEFINCTKPWNGSIVGKGTTEYLGSSPSTITEGIFIDGEDKGKIGWNPPTTVP